MLNKRGHLPTFLLFFLALILVAVTWFTFLSFNDVIDVNAEEIIDLSVNLEVENTYVERVFERTIQKSLENIGSLDETTFYTEFKRINGEIGSISEIDGNYFAKIREDEFSVDFDAQRYVLEIEDVRVFSIVEKHRIESTFDLVAEFDETGFILTKRVPRLEE